MGSTRLPGKAFIKINGIPCIDRVINRLKFSKRLDEIWIATTTKSEDKIFLSLEKKYNIKVFRGNIKNVLSRFEKIAILTKGDYFVRITADCPLIDYKIVDKAIEVCLEKKYDYVSNTIKRTFPDGLDVEVFSKKALENTLKNAKHPFLLEHVTPYIHGNIPADIKHGKFRKFQIKNKKNLSNLRWTLDEFQDLVFLNKICKIHKLDSDWKEISKTQLTNPILMKINNNIPTNEGSIRSLKKYKKKTIKKTLLTLISFFQKQLKLYPLQVKLFLNLIYNGH